MIGGRYLPRGDGVAVGLHLTVPLGEVDRLVTSPALPGPFVVVHGMLRFGFFPGGSAELLILGAPHGLVTSPAGVLNAGTVRFMSPGLRQNVAGFPTIGTGLGLTNEVAFWPWYIYEGQSGALGLWVRRNDLFNPVEVLADCSVWPLVRAEEGDVAREVATSPARRVDVRGYRLPHDSVGVGPASGRVL